VNVIHVTIHVELARRFLAGQDDMLTRRTFTKWAGFLPTTYLLPGTCSSMKEGAEEKDPGLWVTDIHTLRRR
jgi:hypothetical protein